MALMLFGIFVSIFFLLLFTFNILSACDTSMYFFDTKSFAMTDMVLMPIYLQYSTVLFLKLLH